MGRECHIVYVEYDKNIKPILIMDNMLSNYAKRVNLIKCIIEYMGIDDEDTESFKKYLDKKIDIFMETKVLYLGDMKFRISNNIKTIIDV